MGDVSGTFPAVKARWPNLKTKGEVWEQIEKEFPGGRVAAVV